MNINDYDYVEAKGVKGKIFISSFPGIDENDILIVKFLVPALSTNVFNELDKLLSSSSDADPVVPLMGKKGVIFTSSNDKLFLAGADLYEVNEVLTRKDEALARNIIHTGQGIFNRIPLEPSRSKSKKSFASAK